MCATFATRSQNTTRSRARCFRLRRPSFLGHGLRENPMSKEVGKMVRSRDVVQAEGEGARRATGVPAGGAAAGAGSLSIHQCGRTKVLGCGTIRDKAGRMRDNPYVCCVFWGAAGRRGAQDFWVALSPHSAIFERSRRSRGQSCCGPSRDGRAARRRSSRSSSARRNRGAESRRAAREGSSLRLPSLRGTAHRSGLNHRLARPQTRQRVGSGAAASGSASVARRGGEGEV